MSIYGLKPKFQSLLRPAARTLHGAGVTANQVTLAACVVSIAIGGWLAAHPQQPALFLLLPAWLFVRMAFNAIDGMLAREFNQQSRLGAYLNELTDVVSDAMLYLPFAFLPGASPLLVGAVIVLSVISEMAGALGPMVGAARHYEGPMGKSDRAFVFGLLALLHGLGVALSAYFNGIFAVLAVLVALTIVNRVRGGLAE